MQSYTNLLYKFSITLTAIVILLCSCKKLVSIPPPTGSITTSQVFSTDQLATSAMVGIYESMISPSILLNFANGGLSIYAGASADELLFFTNSVNNIQFQKNDLTSTNPVNNTLWTSAYSLIYGTNSVLEGLAASDNIHDSVKNELIGEAEFVRAFCNFYLVNLYGDIPLITTINWQKTNLINRTPSNQVYNAIVTDLLDAQKRLPTDYSVGLGSRIIPNKWAAQALLARVYLYQGDWINAEIQSSAILNNTGLFSLSSDLNKVFSPNSEEAIWQLQQSSTHGPTYYATMEGYELIPPKPTSAPYAYITNNLLNTFEMGDQRKSAWIDSITYALKKYYYPYKYKIGASQASSIGTYTEYYMVLRLAEQYLIRAEAEAHGAGGGTINAVSDLNVIRNRAGLSDYSGPAQTDSVLTAIYHENQVEFFMEWGHRWFDLKRWGKAVDTLTITKGFPISQESLLFPLPQNEINTDPNLTQN